MKIKQAEYTKITKGFQKAIKYFAEATNKSIAEYTEFMQSKYIERQLPFTRLAFDLYHAGEYLGYVPKINYNNGLNDNHYQTAFVKAAKENGFKAY